jgi:hypothetical protein
MSSMANSARSVLLSLGAFLLIVMVGSISLGELCYPADSHVAASLACNLSLFSPLVAAIVAGFVIGWRCRFVVSLLAFFVPTVGVAFLALTGHLQYWYGKDVLAALRLAATYCLTPAVLASVLSSAISARWVANVP